ncbi:hypothetical protein [Leuconostoc mesenteroides]|uniref:hypothetical protein n=1 Tax=Leuconostoc mesenteroides TaxID=1245 RepID=UPI00235E10F5|nr:hypothetical protein [Leuconostoc mesenteroides]
MKKDEVLNKLIAMNTSETELIKASIKNGGGLLKVNSNQEFSKIMLRRSKNYLYEKTISSENRILFDVLSWFRFSDKTLNEFSYIFFVIFDDHEDQIYPLIFKVSDIQKLLEKEGVSGESINLYIQKKRNKDEFVLTRLGTELKNELDVTSHYLNWDILKY